VQAYKATGFNETLMMNMAALCGKSIIHVFYVERHRTEMQESRMQIKLVPD
jgi:hypothetical protein